MSEHSSVLPSTARALLTRLAREQADARVPALAAGVVRDGQLVWSGGRGRTGGRDGDRPDRDTQSRIGSISKPFTAVLVARLRDAGLVDFTDPLDRHLPGTPLGDRTLGQLLSHSSGLQAETAGPWWERTPGVEWDGLAATLSTSMIRHRAGSRFHYSNLGYGLLGELVARLRGKPWYEVLRAEVLDPLEMRRTTYLPEPPHLDGFAVHPWADVLLPEPVEDAGAMAPAGQLWSTVTDLGRWAAFVAGDTGGVLDGGTLEEMRQPNAVDMDGPEWDSGYGLGLQTLKLRDRTLVGHGGSMPGFLAGLFVDVAERMGVTVLANTTSGMALGRLGVDLVEIVAEHEPRLPDEWVPATMPPDTVRNVLAIVGEWYWGPTPHVLRATGGAGWLELGPAGGRGRASRVRPSGRTDEWVGLDGYYAGEPLRAVRRPDGEISHLDLATFVFTRTPYDRTAPVPGGVDPAGWQ